MTFLKLYITPASHRIMNNEVIEVEGQQKVKLADEQSFVSSGQNTMWALQGQYGLMNSFQFSTISHNFMKLNQVVLRLQAHHLENIVI